MEKVFVFMDCNGKLKKIFGDWSRMMLYIKSAGIYPDERTAADIGLHFAGGRHAGYIRVFNLD